MQNYPNIGDTVEHSSSLVSLNNKTGIVVHFEYLDSNGITTSEIHPSKYNYSLTARVGVKLNDPSNLFKDKLAYFWPENITIVNP